VPYRPITDVIAKVTVALSVDMARTDVTVCCPRCGSPLDSSVHGEATIHHHPSDRLKGTRANCTICESDVDVYFY